MIVTAIVVLITVIAIVIVTSEGCARMIDMDVDSRPMCFMLSCWLPLDRLDALNSNSMSNAHDLVTRRCDGFIYLQMHGGLRPDSGGRVLNEVYQSSELGRPETIAS